MIKKNLEYQSARRARSHYSGCWDGDCDRCPRTISLSDVESVEINRLITFHGSLVMFPLQQIPRYLTGILVHKPSRLLSCSSSKLQLSVSFVKMLSCLNIRLNICLNIRDHMSVSTFQVPYERSYEY